MKIGIIFVIIANFFLFAQIGSAETVENTAINIEKIGDFQISYHEYTVNKIDSWKECAASAVVDGSKNNKRLDSINIAFWLYKIN